MLAAVFVEWEYRRGVLRRLGKDDWVGRQDQAAQAAQVGAWCGNVPTKQSSRLGLEDGVVLYFETDVVSCRRLGVPVYVEWGSVADWVSGIGSFAAAATALYIAYSGRRIKLRGYCGHRTIIGGGQPRTAVFTVWVTNISQRPTVVTNIGFSFGVWRWKKNAVIMFVQDQFGHGIPKPLADGESGHWSVPLGNDNSWVKDLAVKFAPNRWDIRTWRVHVYTSNGGSTTLRPEKHMRELLAAAVAQQSPPASIWPKRTRKKPRAA